MYEKAVFTQILGSDEVKILKRSGLHRYLQGTVFKVSAVKLLLLSKILISIEIISLFNIFIFF